MTQVIEALDEQQAREFAELLIEDGDVLAWGESVDFDVDIDVRESISPSSPVDYTQADVDDSLDTLD